MDKLITNLTTIFWFTVIAIAAVLVFWLIQHVCLWTHPKKVSLRMLIAYPEKYHNAPVILTDELVITANDIAQKCFLAYSTTERQFGVEVFYGNLSTAPVYVMMNPHSERISVRGRFIGGGLYHPKIEARKIIFCSEK